MASKVAHQVPAPPISLPPPSTKPQAAVAIAIHSANSVLGSASASNGPLLSKEVKLDELSKYFHLPEKAVAKELGICLTSLKKLCRSYGITRWPFRKLKSLERTMRKVQTVCVPCVCVCVSERERERERERESCLPLCFIVCTTWSLYAHYLSKFYFDVKRGNKKKLLNRRASAHSLCGSAKI
jgi:hypothetical protein